MVQNTSAEAVNTFFRVEQQDIGWSGKILQSHAEGDGEGEGC